jgi:cation:H+ antiporter
MLIHVLQFLLGLAALVAGAEALVRGASKIALTLGISPLVVGLTIVALGTSAPEVAVSVGAVLNDRHDLAIGNVVGSNILNVLLVLGLSALIAPVVVHSQIVRQEVPIMIGATVLLVLMLADGSLGRLDGLVLVVSLAAYVIFLVRQSRAETQATREAYADAFGAPASWDSRLPAQVLLILAGLALLVLGSNWLVDASAAFARAMGVSELVIGLTVVAVGTSMPEVAASMMAAFRGERDIAVGNVIGSNTFNILGCLGVAGLVSSDGLTVAPAVLNFDLWVMVAVAAASLPIFLAGQEIGRGKGAMFVAYYAAYVTYLVLGARQHDALDEYSAIMVTFVLPITVVTLVAMVVRAQSHRRTDGPSGPS